MADLRTAPRPSDTPAPPPYRRSRGPLIALVVLLIIGMAAAVFLVVTAGDDAPRQSLGAPDTATTSVPPTTLDPEAAIKAEIEEAYRESWAAFVAVASDPNARLDDPRLAEHTRGAALAAAELAVRKYKAEGHVLKVDRLELHPQVVELGPGTAKLEDCNIDVSALVHQDTGEVIVPAGPPEPTLVLAEFALVDGRWMQTSFTDTKQVCALPA